MLKPVYDILNCGPRHRFGANGKLVHNSNWQNFRRGGEIRKSILAPSGHKLVIGDESQIEYRLLCWLTGQRDKLDAMIAGRDLYCEFASKFYGETITKDDKPRRGVGKQGILMGGYGAGKGTMIRTAAGGGYGPPVYLDDAQGQMMVDLFRSEHPYVSQMFWKWCDSILPILASGGHAEYQQDGQVVLEIDDHRIWFPNDTAIDYTGMRWATNTEIFPGHAPDDQGYSWWEPTRKGWSRMWGSKLTADIVQGLARVVIVEKLVRAAKRFKVALQVHDEVGGVVPAARAEEEAAWLKQEMEVSCAWCPSIPLAAEVIVAERYEK